VRLLFRNKHTGQAGLLRGSADEHLFQGRSEHVRHFVLTLRASALQISTGVAAAVFF
jgi:hypothetical protein